MLALALKVTFNDNEVRSADSVRASVPPVRRVTRAEVVVRSDNSDYYHTRWSVHAQCAWPYAANPDSDILLLLASTGAIEAVVDARNGAWLLSSSSSSRVVAADAPRDGPWATLMVVTFISSGLGDDAPPLLVPAPGPQSAADVRSLVEAANHPARLHEVSSPTMMKTGMWHAAGRSVVEMRVNVRLLSAVDATSSTAETNAETADNGPPPPSPHAAVLEGELLTRTGSAKVHQLRGKQGKLTLGIEPRQLPLAGVAHLARLSTSSSPLKSEMIILRTEEHRPPLQLQRRPLSAKQAVLAAWVRSVEANPSSATDALARRTHDPYVRLMGSGVNAALVSNAETGSDVTGGYIVAERGSGVATTIAAVLASELVGTTVVMCSELRAPAWRAAFEVADLPPHRARVFSPMLQLTNECTDAISRALRVIIDEPSAMPSWLWRISTRSAFMAALHGVRRRWVVFSSMERAQLVSARDTVPLFLSRSSVCINDRYSEDVTADMLPLPLWQLQVPLAPLRTTYHTEEIASAADTLPVVQYVTRRVCVSWLADRDDKHTQPPPGIASKNTYAAIRHLRMLCSGMPPNHSLLRKLLLPNTSNTPSKPPPPPPPAQSECYACYEELVAGNAVQPGCGHWCCVTCVTRMGKCGVCRAPIAAPSVPLQPPACTAALRPAETKIAAAAAHVLQAVASDDRAVVVVLTLYPDAMFDALRQRHCTAVLNASTPDDVKTVLSGTAPSCAVVANLDAAGELPSLPATRIVCVSPPLLPAETDALHRFARPRAAPVDVFCIDDTFEARTARVAMPMVTTPAAFETLFF